MSLLNAVGGNQENNVGSSPASSGHHPHGPSGMGVIKQSHNGISGSGVYGEESGGMGSMHVKPEIQQQHSVDSIDTGSHTRSPITPGSQRSPSSLGSHGMGGSIVEACSRYGLSGSVSTPTTPECSGSGGYANTSMNPNQQSHNSYQSGSRSSTLPSSYGHCVPNPFNFSVNNLIHRNYKI